VAQLLTNHTESRRVDYIAHLTARGDHFQSLINVN